MEAPACRIENESGSCLFVSPDGIATARSPYHGVYQKLWHFMRMMRGADNSVDTSGLLPRARLPLHLPPKIE